jgi:hypothetical protein
MHTFSALVLNLAPAEVLALAQHDDLRRLVLSVIFIEHALAVVRAHRHRGPPRDRLPALDVLELVRGVVLAVVRVPRDLRAHAREERRRGALRVPQPRGQLRVRRVPAPRRHERGRATRGPASCTSTSCFRHAPHRGSDGKVARDGRARPARGERDAPPASPVRTPSSCGTSEAD